METITQTPETLTQPAADSNETGGQALAAVEGPAGAVKALPVGGEHVLPAGGGGNGSGGAEVTASGALTAEQPQPTAMRPYARDFFR